MKNLKKILLAIIFIFSALNLQAETWNEPWQKEIIEKSDYFVFGKVIENNGKNAKIKIEKRFGNEITPDEIIIDNYFLLELTSSSGETINIDLKRNSSYYLFLKKNKNNNYSLPTPTSGFVELDNKNVIATYRHSYHQASIPQIIYELTFENIWSYYKTGKFDKTKILNFINDYLSKHPAGFAENEISLFYLQHSALETAYLLDLMPNINDVLKFAKSENFHSRVSALQLLGNYKTKESDNYLISVILDKTSANFEKVIAIWSIKKSNNKEYFELLKKNISQLSGKSEGFGGNIMDPRVGTYFPSPKQAVESL